jgi:hypothetical protein
MDIDNRVIRLEEFAAVTGERLARIESRLEDTVTKADLAEKVGELKAELAGKVGELKSDIHRTANETIRWIVGMGVGLGVAAITIITFVLNYATPKAPVTPVTSAAPITIYTQPVTPATPATPTPTAK